MKRRRFLTLSAAFACAPRFAQAATWEGRALGADVSVTLTGPQTETQAAFATLVELLESIEKTYSLYREDSALAQLNTVGFLQDHAVFCDILPSVQQAYSLTDGLFDPTVQPLWRAHAHGLPTETARQQIGWQRVQFSSTDITLAPGQQLTFNGIAQGHATDLVRAHLRGLGFTQALVNIGEHAALGGPFRLGLSDPQHGVLGQRTLRDSAIATSSPGALSLGAHTHIIGPQDQSPLWSTISVEAASATLADALSTAAVFMPRDRLAHLKNTTHLARITAIDPEGNLLTL